MEVRLKYPRESGELLTVEAGVSYVTGCNCDELPDADHAHVTRLKIYRTLDELGFNVLLERDEEQEATRLLKIQVEEILEAAEGDCEAFAC